MAGLGYCKENVMNDKVVDISDKQDKTLYMCLVCRHAWAGKEQRCPKCTSYSVIRDELHILPETHGLYCCGCDNPYFKIGNHPRRGIYFKCVQCGKNTWPEDVGLK